MKIRSIVLAAIVASIFAGAPAWADRGYRGGYEHGGHGGGHFWGPFGFLVGSAIIFSALQPRTVYYEPRVVYAPPVYYYPSTTYVQPYPVAGDQVVVQNYEIPAVASMPPPPAFSSGVQNVQPGPGTSGEQWWYACKKPAGYYPYVKECPSGWEKVSPTPPGKINP